MTEAKTTDILIEGVVINNNLNWGSLIDKIVDEESGELPVGSEVKFLQKNSSSIADIPQVSEAAINKSNVAFLLYFI